MTVPPPADSESAFKMMTIVFVALLSGQLIFLAVILVIHSQGFEFKSEDVEMLVYVGMAALLAGIGIGTSLHRTILRSALAQNDPPIRIVKYNTATILRLAFLEGTNLVNLVFYLLTGDNLFLMLFMFGLVAFIFARPIRETFFSDLQFSRTTTIS